MGRVKTDAGVVAELPVPLPVPMPVLMPVLMLASVCSAPAANASVARCQNASTVADILSTGDVNLLRFGAFADGATDDAATLRSAIGCHNRVFIPAATHWPVAPAKGTPAYLINSTVVLADSDPCPQCPHSVGQIVQLRGVGQHATPASVLRTHGSSPVIQVGDWEWKYSTGAKVALQDLAIDAVRVGVLVVATSDVHLVRVTITVTEWGEHGPPEVTIPKQDHAALVAVDVYWLYVDSCTFVGATPPGYDGQHNTSKRPSVIFRGQDNPSNSPSRAAVVNQVYLVTITDTVFNFGGIQYQQLSPRCSPPDAGFFEFKNVVQESSDTPLLDIVGDPNANASTRATFGQITVNGYMSADAGEGSSLKSQSGIIRFNLTEPGGVLNGVTVMGAGDTPAAVVAITGRVKNINVMQSALAGVVNGSGAPIGPAVVGTVGGLSFTGMATCLPHTEGCDRQHNLNASEVSAYTLESAEHPIMIGHSGEAFARLAIESDGSLLWGNGASAFDTTLRRHIARAVPWDPESIAPGMSTAILVDVDGALPGDVASAALERVGMARVLVAANIASEGRVQVIVQNLGSAAVDIEPGVLRVAVTQYG